MSYQYSSRKRYFSSFLEMGAAVFFFPIFFFKRKRENKAPKILLVEPFQMGDVLSLLPLIDPLKKKYRDCKIYILTKPSSGGILKYDSRIDEVISSNFFWSDYGKKKVSILQLIQTLRFIFFLRKYRFDIGIDTRGDVRSQLILFFSGCLKRIGYTNYLHSNISLKGYLLTDKKIKSSKLHRYEWNVEVLGLLGIQTEQLLPINFPVFFPDKLTANSVKKRKSFVIHIGGGWEFKRWENIKWAKLIEQLSERDKESMIRVISGPGEKELLAEVKELVDEKDNVSYKVTSFEELIWFIDECEQFIGLDSGPMNLAICLNKKVVALYGPGDSSMWRPLNAGSKFIHHKDSFPCNPCLQKKCFYPNDSCMKAIQNQEVLDLVEISTSELKVS